MRRQSAHEGLELFKMTVPSLRTIYALHKPSYGPATRALKDVKDAAGRARITIKPVTVQSHKDIAKALNEIRKLRKLAIVVSEQVLSFALEVADHLLVLEGGRIVHTATRQEVDAERIKR